MADYTDESGTWEELGQPSGAVVRLLKPDKVSAAFLAKQAADKVTVESVGKVA